MYPMGKATKYPHMSHIFFQPQGWSVMPRKSSWTKRCPLVIGNPLHGSSQKPFFVWSTGLTGYVHKIGGGGGTETDFSESFENFQLKTAIHLGYQGYKDLASLNEGRNRLDIFLLLSSGKKWGGEDV